MSLLDEFTENTAIFRSDEARIDQTAFEALAQKHGEDVAKGYLKALYEFTELLGEAMTATIKGTDLRRRETPTNFMGKMSVLHHALFDFAANNALEVEKLRKPSLRDTKAKTWT